MPNPSARPPLVRHLAVLAVVAGSFAVGLSSARTSPRALAADATLPRTPAASPFVQLVEDGHAWMSATLTGASRKTTASVDADTSPRAPRSAGRLAGVLPPSLLVPQVGVFVHDWRSSVRLAGAASTVLDDVRPSASARMVLVRVATGNVVAPFVQMGVGQWRLDPQHFPTLASETELAGQIGAGLELRLGRFNVAAEAHEMAIYRERRAGEAVPGFPAMIGGSLAARGSF